MNFVCPACQQCYPIDQARWRCDCGSYLDLDFKPVFDLEKIQKRERSMWRYREAIPVKLDENIVSFGEGYTPLEKFSLDGYQVLIKQDHLFPTGSYKDRGASVMISKIREWGIEKVVEDSSGNAGSSVSGYAAKAGMKCDIYVPADNSAAKLVQIAAYGANLHKIPGSREATAEAAFQAAQHTHYASHSWNPFFFQGTKTFAYEVCEQLGWRSPDVVVLPAGHGTLLLGAWLGFRDLYGAGVISKLPRIIAVQSAGCSPLYEAFIQGLDDAAKVEKRDTLAEGIAILYPLRGKQILQAVRQTGGEFVVVDDEEIRAALLEMCKQGCFIEPTSAAVIAGLKKFVRSCASDQTIVSMFTGHGLKAADKIFKISRSDLL